MRSVLCCPKQTTDLDCSISVYKSINTNNTTRINEILFKFNKRSNIQHTIHIKDIFSICIFIYTNTELFMINDDYENVQWECSMFNIIQMFNVYSTSISNLQLWTIHYTLQEIFTLLIIWCKWVLVFHLEIVKCVCMRSRA